MAKSPEGSRAAGARGWISGLIDDGLSNTQIVQFLRAFDLSYRNQEMLRDINRERLGRIYQDDIRGLGPGEAVPVEKMTPIRGRPVEPFRTIVTGDYENLATGEIEKRTITLHHRRAPSQNDVLGVLEGFRDLYKEAEGISLVSLTKIEYFKVVPFNQ